MKRMEFRDWFAQVPTLSRGQQDQVRQALGPGHSAPVSPTVTWLEALPIPVCPGLPGGTSLRWGHQADLQRYRCRSCRHTVTVLSGTPLARLRHKEQWGAYCEALQEGLTVCKAAQPCGIDKTTSFRWRHRFLKSPANTRAEALNGIVEADETFFPYSCKGQRHLDRPARKRGKAIRSRGTGKDPVPVLVVRDRSGATADFQLTTVDTPTVEARLGAQVAQDAILFSDGAAVYRNVARNLDLTHRPVNLAQGIRVVAGVYHIQNVNAYDSRLKEWMKRFHGVATQYLENYLGWRRWLERWGGNISPLIGLYTALGRKSQLQLLMQT